MGSGQLHQLNEQNWDQEVLQSAQPVLVDFWAEWCGPCLRIAPIVEAIAGEYAGRLKVGKLNVDENPDLASRYGVMSIPTLMVFKNGEPKEFIVGLQPKTALVRRIEAVLQGS
ncbi:MAG: thioredoxin [Limnochordaceae bacterium]|nr:thioredoxin [Limnochordaceae bacterium]